jgi:hypothetical protein
MSKTIVKRVWLILNKGRTGETYNVGGECEKQNIEVVKEICDILEELHPLKDNPTAGKQAPHITRYSDPSPLSLTDLDTTGDTRSTATKSRTSLDGNNHFGSTKA